MTRLRPSRGSLLALALFASVSPAAAESLLGTFTARCLERYAHIFPADVSGLTFQGTTDGVEVWSDGATTLHRATPGGREEAFCLITGPMPEVETAQWVAELLASGHYTEVTLQGQSQRSVLQSTEWREPRIEIVIDRAPQPSLMVRETDLES